MSLPKTWTICRICLQQHNKMHNIFNAQPMNDDKEIWMQLSDCGGVPINRDDNLPQEICDECFENLCKANTFRIACQRAHYELMDVVSRPRQTFNYDQILYKQEAEEDEYTDNNISTGDEPIEMNSSLYSYSSYTKDDNYLSDENVDLPTFKREFQDEFSNDYRFSMKLTSEINHKNPKCKVCNKTFPTTNLLRHHSYTHKKPHECKVCGKTFSQVQGFKCHMNLHTGNKPYNCRICTKRFADATNRNRHERTIHKDYNDQYVCMICLKTFRLLEMLERHKASHKSPPFPLPVLAD